MGYCDSNFVVRQLPEEGGVQSGAGNFASRELTEPELGLVSAVGLPVGGVAALPRRDSGGHRAGRKGLYSVRSYSNMATKSLSNICLRNAKTVKSVADSCLISSPNRT